ncbi:peptidoglycan DD-metalloendopeptidase family protein [Spirillospora sp. NPDC049652]
MIGALVASDSLLRTITNSVAPRDVITEEDVSPGVITTHAPLAATTDSSSSSPEDATGWRWPLGPPVPAVVRDFSPPTSPWLPGHRGVDLAASPGEPVYAAGRGRVSYAGVLAGRNVVAITHGELRTTYLPVRPAVPVGRDVPAGARIGTVEAIVPTHCSQACLHWGLLRGATYLDPLALVRPLVRLLPLWQPDSEPAPPGVPFPPSPQDTGRSFQASPDLGTLPGLGHVPERRALPGRQVPSGRHDPQNTQPAHGVAPKAKDRQPPKDEQPLRPALRGASTATTGLLTCLVLALALAFVRRVRSRPRSRPHEDHQAHRQPPNVIDLAHERRLRRPIERQSR